jgi:hypothetical protein
VQTALAALLVAVTCSESPAGGGTAVRVRCHNRAATALDILVPGYGGPASLTLLRGASGHPWLVRREAGGRVGPFASRSSPRASSAWRSTPPTPRAVRLPSRPASAFPVRPRLDQQPRVYRDISGFERRGCR